MRALVCEAYGPVENLKVADLAVPEPKAGEILVRVGAAGVSFAALLGMQGKHQNKPALPYVPGNELAGHVVKLGPGVSNLAVGQRITTGVSQGAYAEYAVATAANAVAIPETMPYAQATNFPTLYPTAYGALKWKADMQPGEVLLVHGAGGGSGLTAIEVGKAMGAVVIASAGSTHKLKAALDAGADYLINHRTEDLRMQVLELTGGRGADVVYDPVGGPYAEPAVRSLAWLGRYLVVGFAAGEIPKLPLNLVLLRGCDIRGVFWGAWLRREPEAQRAIMTDIVKWCAEGKLSAHVHAVYPLAEIATALKAISDRKVMGKILLRP